MADLIRTYSQLGYIVDLVYNLVLKKVELNIYTRDGKKVRSIHQF